MKCFVDDREFGRVQVNLRRGMRSVTARWHDNRLVMSAPPGISPAELAATLDGFRERLRAIRESRPAVTFAIGQVIDCFRCRVKLVEQRRFAGRMTFGRDGDLLTLGLPAGMDLDTGLGRKNVSRGLQALLEREAWQVLLPYAAGVAGELGVSPERWEVGRGMRKLGHCTRRPPRTIQLSRNLMFFNERLVRYIICHELAHLTHADHSPRFHALVDRYTDGQEAALEQELRRFEWPIVR